MSDHDLSNLRRTATAAAARLPQPVGAGATDLPGNLLLLERPMRSPQSMNVVTTNLAPDETAVAAAIYNAYFNHNTSDRQILARQHSHIRRNHGDGESSVTSSSVSTISTNRSRRPPGHSYYPSKERIRQCFASSATVTTTTTSTTTTSTAMSSLSPASALSPPVTSKTNDRHHRLHKYRHNQQSAAYAQCPRYDELEHCHENDLLTVSSAGRRSLHSYPSYQRSLIAKQDQVVNSRIEELNEPLDVNDHKDSDYNDKAFLSPRSVELLRKQQEQTMGLVYNEGEDRQIPRTEETNSVEEDPQLTVNSNQGGESQGSAIENGPEENELMRNREFLLSEMERVNRATTPPLQQPKPVARGTPSPNVGNHVPPPGPSHYQYPEEEQVFHDEIRQRASAGGSGGGMGHDESIAYRQRRGTPSPLPVPEMIGETCIPPGYHTDQYHRRHDGGVAMQRRRSSNSRSSGGGGGKPSPMYESTESRRRSSPTNVDEAAAAASAYMHHIPYPHSQHVMLRRRSSSSGGGGKCPAVDVTPRLYPTSLSKSPTPMVPDVDETSVTSQTSHSDTVVAAMAIAAAVGGSGRGSSSGGVGRLASERYPSSPLSSHRPPSWNSANDNEFAFQGRVMMEDVSPRTPPSPHRQRFHVRDNQSSSAVAAVSANANANAPPRPNRYSVYTPTYRNPTTATASAPSTPPYRPPVSHPYPEHQEYDWEDPLSNDIVMQRQQEQWLQSQAPQSPHNPYPRSESPVFRRHQHRFADVEGAACVARRRSSASGSGGSGCTYGINHHRPMVEIAPGYCLPLRGAQETHMACLEPGRSTLVQCVVCRAVLQCIIDCQAVVCPDCRTVTPNDQESNGSGGGSGVENDGFYSGDVNDDNDAYYNDHYRARPPSLVKFGVGLGIKV